MTKVPNILDLHLAFNLVKVITLPNIWKFQMISVGKLPGFLQIMTPTFHSTERYIHALYIFVLLIVIW